MRNRQRAEQIVTLVAIAILLFNMIFFFANGFTGLGIVNAVLLGAIAILIISEWLNR